MRSRRVRDGEADWFKVAGGWLIKTKGLLASVVGSEL